jgi:hypothetical protein
MFGRLMGASWEPTIRISYYMKKERKIKNENGAKKQQKTTFLMQMTYCDRRV